MSERKFCDILIEHADCLNEDMEILRDQAVVITEGTITAVFPMGEGTEGYEPYERVDGSGKLWMPGLIDGHMHTGQQLLKGRVLDELPMIWTRIMLPFESTMTPEKMRLSARLAAMEMIKNGTTGFIESGGYFMEEAATIYERVGLRGAVSHSTMDQGNFPDSIRQTAEEAVAETDRLYERFHGRGNLKVFYSLRALMNCSEKLIGLAADHARERSTSLQAHMNEYPGEVNYTLEKYQLRPVEYLEKLGILDRRFLAAHGILLSPGEMELLQERGASVVHCPFSNCGKGVPETPELLKRGIPVGLGTDGAAHGGLSLWNEMKIFRSVMNAVWGTRNAEPRIMPAKTILKMATQGGAAALGEAGSLGMLKPGYKADIISVDFRKPELFATGNPVNTLLECVTGGDVADSMVDGIFLMRDRRLTTMDEERITRLAKQYFETGEVAE